MTQPEQKPGRSKQNYGTPKNFLDAVKQRLCITEFAFDFAADSQNAKADRYWGEAEDSLGYSGGEWRILCGSGWGWLNPPFSDIAPWALRCLEMKAGGGSIAFLVPAGVGANWFRDYVDGQALVLLLNGRLAFMPDKPTWLYPKDCILCLYSPNIEPGYEVWNWREVETGNQASVSEIGSFRSEAP